MTPISENAVDRAAYTNAFQAGLPIGAKTFIKEPNGTLSISVKGQNGFTETPSGEDGLYATRALAEAAVFAVKPSAILIQNFDVVGDGGGFVATEVDAARGAILAAAPIGNRSAVRLDVNGTDVWYENSENPVKPEQFGAKGDRFSAQTDDRPAFVAMDEHCSHFLKPSQLWPGLYHMEADEPIQFNHCLLYTSPSPRDQRGSRMPSSA